MIRNIIFWINIFLLMLLLGAIGLFVFDRIIMPKVTRLNEEFTLPDVNNIQFENAQEILEKRGFIAIKSKEKVDYNSAIGEVLEQNPKGGTTCKKGRRVYLTVSKGGLPAIVPELTGISPQEAIYRIEKAKIRLDTLYYDFSMEYPKGVIMKQQYAKGDTISIGDSLAITLSLGRRPDEFLVPNLVDLSYEKAAKVIKENGFRVGFARISFAKELVPNTVIDQLPKPNSIATEGSLVHLEISTLAEDSLRDLEIDSLSIFVRNKLAKLISEEEAGTELE